MKRGSIATRVGRGLFAAASAIFITSFIWSADASAADDNAGVFTSASGLTKVEGLDVAVDGSTVHMLLSGRDSAGAQAPAVLRYIRSDDGGATWSQPVAIDTADAAPHHAIRGNDSQIAARGDNVLAIWQIKGSGFMDRGPMHSAFSQDGGKTWTRGPIPTDDGNDTGHAFNDMSVAADGALLHAWLDDRDGPRGLRFATSRDGGQSWTKNATVDPVTCECCWNTVANTAANHVYILYRDVEPRDMGLARSFDGGQSWQEMGAVGAFDWQATVCPHVGGGLAVVPGDEADTLHATVWTGKDTVLGTYYLRSRDGGQSWSEPKRLGDNTAKHIDIAALDADHIVTVWDEQRSDGSTIYLGRSQDGGDTWTVDTVRQAGDWLATHPRVVNTPFGLRVLWTEMSADGEGHWAMAKY